MKSYNRQIEQYLKGELSSEEANAFEEAMKNDPGLAKEVEYNKIANEIIVEDGLSSVKARLRKIHEPTVIGKRLLVFSIASLMFIGLGVGTFLYYDDSETNTFSTQPQAYNLQDNQNTDNKEAVKPALITENENDLEKEKDEVIDKPSVNKSLNKNSSDLVVEKNTTEVEGINNIDSKESTEDIADSDTVLVKKDVCDEVAIYANVIIENTCSHVNNGSVLIETNSISGGEGPYQYAIIPSTKRVRVSEVPFSEGIYYDSLSSGYYNFLIKDKNGCMSYSERAVLIRTSNCSVNSELIQLNSKDKNGWLINDSLTVKASLIIKDVSTNQIIFKEDFKPGNSLRWYGKDSLGNYLEKGSYNYKVEYHNGTSKSGTLKIQ